MSNHYAVCIKNTGYEASLEVRKLYEVIADTNSCAPDQMRVIDESGEDYLYPTENFVPVTLPETVERALCSSI